MSKKCSIGVDGYKPFKGHDISRKSLADLIVKLAVTPGLEVRQSLGVSKPE